MYVNIYANHKHADGTLLVRKIMTPQGIKRDGWWPQKPPTRGVQSHILKFKYPSLKFSFTENNIKRSFVLALSVWETELHVAEAILELTGVPKNGLEFLVFLLCLPEL